MPLEVFRVACIIMNNMILEDESTLNLISCFKEDVVEMGCGLTFQQFKNGIKEIENCETNDILKKNIIEHLWDLKNNAHVK